LSGDVSLNAEERLEISKGQLVGDCLLGTGECVGRDEELLHLQVENAFFDRFIADEPKRNSNGNQTIASMFRQASTYL